MAALAVGDVALAKYPFTDLSDVKLRPVFVAAVDRDDFLFCMITSQPHNDNTAIKIPDGDIASSNLYKVSWVRPRRVFTGNISIIQKKLGHVSPEFAKVIKETIAAWVSS